MHEEKENRVIKYRCEGVEFKTRCPSGMRTFKSNQYKMVGGHACRMCHYFVSVDVDEQKVVCNNPRKARRWVSRL